MFLALAGALIVGMPSVLFAIWFSWLTHRRFLRGGFLLVARTWVVVLASIAGALTVVSLPSADTSFGLLYYALVVFCILAIGGGIPSAVMALVVSGLTYWWQDSRDDYELNIAYIVVLGTISGLLAALPALQLSFKVLSALWHP
jgi:hypothetical protein